MPFGTMYCPSNKIYLMIVYTHIFNIVGYFHKFHFSFPAAYPGSGRR